jgi:hypothetical protein
VAADLAVPQAHAAVQITRYRWVDVPLYRTGDLFPRRSGRVARSSLMGPLRCLRVLIQHSP